MQPAIDKMQKHCTDSKAVKFAAAFALCFSGLAASLPASAQGNIELALPVACEIGRDCFVQQYPDVNTAGNARDYRCGKATYARHSGTDFRAMSMKAAAGIAVIASAPGRIKAVRDGMEDRFVSATAVPQLENRECGNGVVIDHGGGWETQYCHLRRGSIQVRGGQTVATGAPLGLIGASGQAQFAHVHFSVRLNGKNVDPFSAKEYDGTCDASGPEIPSGMWAPTVRGSLKYRGAVIIEKGFAGDAVSPAQAELGDVASLGSASPALVFYVRMINMETGDGIRISVVGPEGFRAESQTAALTSNKAHYVAFAGKKLRGERWPLGQYHGRVELLRGGQVIASAEDGVELK